MCFSSVSAFDAHRVGSQAERKCLDVTDSDIFDFDEGTCKIDGERREDLFYVIADRDRLRAAFANAT
jgi:hypothetical protein